MQKGVRRHHPIALFVVGRPVGFYGQVSIENLSDERAELSADRRSLVAFTVCRSNNAVNNNPFKSDFTVPTMIAARRLAKLGKTTTGARLLTSYVVLTMIRKSESCNKIAATLTCFVVASSAHNIVPILRPHNPLLPPNR